jgi:hypothetical protein
MRHNVTSMLDWQWLLLTPPLCVLIAATLLWLIAARRSREGWLLAGLLGITIGPYIVSAGSLFPRYLHFSATPLAVLAGAGVWSLTEALVARVRPVAVTRVAGLDGPGLLATGMLATLLIWPLRSDVTIATEPERAALPPIDRAQYISAWPAGYGTREMARFLDNASEKRCGVTVVRLHYWDHPLQGLDLFLEPSANLNLFTVDSTQSGWFEQVEDLARQRTTFFALNPQRDDHAHTALVARFRSAPRVFVYPRPGTTTGVEVWQISRRDPVADSSGAGCDRASIELLTQPGER